MALWQYTCDEFPRSFLVKKVLDAWRVWRCLECGKECELYHLPWSWFWVTVAHRDLMDDAFTPAVWLGQVGSLRGYRFNTVTFTVIPFNRLVNLVIHAYHWCRSCSGDSWTNALEESYRRGCVDGRSEEHARLLAKLQRLDEEAMRAGLEWRQLGCRIPDKAADLLRDN